MVARNRWWGVARPDLRLLAKRCATILVAPTPPPTAKDTVFVQRSGVLSQVSVFSAAAVVLLRMFPSSPARCYYRGCRGEGGFPRACPPPPRPAFCAAEAPQSGICTYIPERSPGDIHSMHARRTCLQKYENGHSPHRRALLLRECRWSAGTAAFAATAVVAADVVAAATVLAVFVQLQPSLVVGAGQQSSRCPTLLRGWVDEAPPRCPAVVAASSSGPPATVVLAWRVLQDPPSTSRGLCRTAARMGLGCWGPGALHCSCRVGGWR